MTNKQRVMKLIAHAFDGLQKEEVLNIRVSDWDFGDYDKVKVELSFLSPRPRNVE